MKADVDERLILPVVESIESLLKEIFNIEILRGKMVILNIPFISMGIGAIIDISGDFNGRIFIDMKPETALRMASLFLNENISKFDETAISTVGEILNTIAGRIVNKINSYGYGKIKISTPKIITKFTKIKDIESKNVILIPLGFENYIINTIFYLS